MSRKGKNIMKKTYKIDVDCANCANKMERSYERCFKQLQESRRRLRNLSLIHENHPIALTAMG